jgi:prevent-host-death family protein
MRTIQVVDAKAKFSALLAAVEAGEEIAITRHGKVVARIVPDTPRMAADLFRPFWEETDIDLEAPEDTPPEPTPDLD